jgi:transcriptional regulator with XRE-family HTH domain
MMQKDKQKMQKKENSLRRLRKLQGLTLQKLSEMSGVSVGSLGNYETGSRGIGSDALGRIAEILHVDVAEITESYAENAVRDTGVAWHGENGRGMCDGCTIREKRIATLEEHVASLTRLAECHAATIARLSCGICRYTNEQPPAAADGDPPCAGYTK